MERRNFRNEEVIVRLQNPSEKLRFLSKANGLYVRTRKEVTIE